MLTRMKRAIARRRMVNIYRSMRKRSPDEFSWAETVISRINPSGAVNEGGGEMRPLKLVELRRLLDQHKPDSALEMGTGGTTAVMVDYGMRTGARIVCMDEHEQWLENSKTVAGGSEAPPNIRFLRRDKLLDLSTKPTTSRFDPVIEEEFDFVFIDGPSFRDEKNVPYRGVNTDIFTIHERRPPKVIVVDLRMETVHAIAERLGKQYKVTETDRHMPHTKSIDAPLNYYSTFVRNELVK